jgi:two-component system sensor histidine kinase ChvG
MNLYWGGPERRITGLTLRIIAINAAALVMLLVGIVYLSQYQTTLIESRLRTFKSEVELASAALSETLSNQDIETAKRMVWRFSRTMGQHVYLFNENGQLLADSGHLSGYEDFQRFADDREKSPVAIQVLKDMAKFILRLLPARHTLPPYREIVSENAADFSDAAVALNGAVSISAWQKDEDIFLSAAAPIMIRGNVAGAVMLAREGRDIGRDIGDVWLNILIIFVITLVITTLLSIYLSNVITAPLRKLANAADSVRRGKSKDTEIPDLSSRKDEIGELSIMLRDMTHALWERMDSIERFAADVAHELKNPLTSLRSAVETVSVVKKDTDRQKLMAIISHDVERMDRLITDISSASRLDSELSREALRPVDLKNVLGGLLEIMRGPAAQETNVRLVLDYPEEKNIFIWGLEGRVFQILDNLVSNAVSFSPEGGTVTITVAKSRKTVIITIEDEGPGIPEGKLETIFERFYTERPQHEAYGKHSGLGLSICRQIVTALGGNIFAGNIHDEQGHVTGARFTVVLNAA